MIFGKGSKMNSVQLIGRIGSDIQYIPCNQTRSVRRFAMVFRSKTKPTGEDDSYWIDCECWDKVGEKVDKYCFKGQKIAIAGRLVQQRFIRKDGTKASKIVIVISSIEFIEPKKQEENEEVEEQVEDEDIPF